MSKRERNKKAEKKENGDLNEHADTNGRKMKEKGKINSVKKKEEKLKKERKKERIGERKKRERGIVKKKREKKKI
ncbi:hypothetical protein FYL88_26380 [Salmonella enterica subsp. enterica serovar Typhimurium]|nr:hypothetical protein FYL88_26380 [Salmonella enterica subsp. enterica serovar Typhimurium]